MQLKIGEIVEGTVKSLTKFGAFVALDANTTGLVHISEVAHAYVSDLHEYLTEGQTVKVMVIGLDNGKINLSIKRTLPAPTREQSQRPRGSFQQRQSQPNRQQPSAPQQKSFDDMLKQFMSESAKTMSGVLIRRSNAPAPNIPISINRTQSPALKMQAVYTEVLTFLNSFAPKNLETTTEQPILQPKAKAMKINVIS